MATAVARNTTGTDQVVQLQSEKGVSVVVIPFLSLISCFSFLTLVHNFCFEEMVKMVKKA